MMPTRRAAVTMLTATAVSSLTTTRARAEPDEAVLYKNPQCDCCEGYAAHLRDHGYRVRVVPTHDLALIKRDDPDRRLRGGRPRPRQRRRAAAIGTTQPARHIAAGHAARLPGNGRAEDSPLHDLRDCARTHSAARSLCGRVAQRRRR